jgi:serine/threonine protein kinase
MDKNAALAHLGLTGDEDPGQVTKAYSAHLATVQERLVSAQTEADRINSQTQLSQLVEAFELVTATGRYTKVRADEAGATVVRTAEEIAATEAIPGGTSVRMEPGAVLSGRIELGELLGSGGMGNVYAARDRLKDEDVAIKVLRQDLIFSSAAKERFLAEAKMSCSLSHPNIVRVHDVGVSGNHYYFSMERLRGQTLRQRLEAYHRDNKQFSLAEVTDVARQLIDALRYAHRYIVHRDVKPENIWLAEDGTVKLMDFGIARAYSSVQLTQTGMTLGTAYYMAPEQRLTAKEADWRADQYSLGVVLYELLSGSVPIGAVKPLPTVRRDVSNRYAQALMRAMAPKPDDRWTSLNEMLAELQAPASRAPKTAVAVVLLGSVLVAVGAGAVYFGGFRNLLSPQASSAGAAKGAAASSTAAVQANGNGTSSSGSSVEPPAGPPSEPPTETATALAGAAPAAQEQKSSLSVADSMTSAVPESVASTETAATAPGAADADTVPEQKSTAAPVPIAKSTAPKAKTHESANDESAPARVAMVDPSPVARCIAQCERDQGECRSINRRGKQECMRAVAFNASGGRISPSTSNDAAADCAFFGRARCEYARDPGSCLNRMRSRYDVCVSNASGNVAARRQDCDDKARDADQLCLTEVRDCRQSCE